MASDSADRISFPADLRAWWHLFLERAWWFAASVTVCAVAGSIYAVRLPKIYEATTTVQVETEQQRLVKIDNRRSEEATDEEVLETIEQKLLNPGLALRLVHHPEVAADPAFLRHIPRPASDARLRDALSRQISASVRRGTSLIDVTVEDEDPAMAQKLARLLVEEYLRGSAEDRVAVSRVASDHLREEAGRLQARLSKSEHALQQYKVQHRAVSLEEKQNIVVERLKELSAKVTAAKTERLKLETERAQIELLAGEPPEKLLAFSSIAGAEEVGELRRKIHEKETEIAALSRRYKPEHPKFIQAASEIAELRSALAQGIQKAAQTMSAGLDAAQITESKLEQALRGQEELALELSKVAIPYEALEREVISDRALYDSLLGRLKEAEIGQGISQHAVHVVAPALLPDRPSKPNRRLILLLSIGAGCALGLTLALGSSLLDDSLKTVNQAEQALGLRSLGAIPARAKTKLADAARLLVDKPQSAIAECFRAVRTALHFAAGDNDYRVVLFTSAIPGEGKSFCAINYAIALAQQHYRTLLIDADLRLPSIGKVFFPGEEPPGLSDLLLGRCELEEAVRSAGIDKLSIIAAGAPVSHPAELVGGGLLDELLELALDDFDRVVIDTAPVHAVSETLVLASAAKAVCLVVRAGKTPGLVAVRALQRLRDCGAQVPGFVLNGVPARNGGYYYHYHAPGYGKDEVYGGSALIER